MGIYLLFTIFFLDPSQFISKMVGFNILCIFLILPHSCYPHVYVSVYMYTYTSTNVYVRTDVYVAAIFCLIEAPLLYMCLPYAFSIALLVCIKVFHIIDVILTSLTEVSIYSHHNDWIQTRLWHSEEQIRANWVCFCLHCQHKPIFQLLRQKT